MTLRDRILDALTRQGGITVGALAVQWILPASREDALQHREAIKEEVKKLLQEKVIVKIYGYLYLKDLRRIK